MTGDLILLVLAALPLMGSPGPATLSLAALGAAFGARASVNYLLGIILGTTGVLLLIAAGITGLILAEPALTTVMCSMSYFPIQTDEASNTWAAFTADSIAICSFSLV